MALVINSNAAWQSQMFHDPLALIFGADTALTKYSTNRAKCTVLLCFDIVVKLTCCMKQKRVKLDSCFLSAV